MKLCPARLVLLALAAASLGSCRGPSTPATPSTGSGPVREAPAPRAEAEAWPPGATELVSNAGGFRLRFASEPSPPPTNEPYRLLVGVTGPVGEPIGSAARLAVDGWMPDHLHGLVRGPRVRELEPGRWAVEGLLLHMPGRWELFFDLTRGALTERAQTELELD